MRRHDFDVQNMETMVSPREQPQNPIDPPQVTVRSEFPTLTRSKNQQALTCLVTIEVPERKWTGQNDDGHTPPVPIRAGEETYRAPSPSTSNRSGNTYGNPATKANLEQITEDLRQRVENWHSLDVSRYESTMSKMLLARTTNLLTSYFFF